MATTRSPRYPNVSLPDAISKAKMIYNKEHMSPLTPQVAAEAMGYSGLNGASLKMISSLKKYSLLEGRGDDVRLTKDAQTLIIEDSSSPDYADAAKSCALSPEVFSDIHRQFKVGGSERNIAIYVERQGFKPDAAAMVARNYKETMALVGEEDATYNETAPAAGGAPPPMAEGRTADFGKRESKPEPRSGISLEVAQENEIKVLLDGKRLRVAAWVDSKGLQRLRRILDANAPLIEDNESGGAQD